MNPISLHCWTLDTTPFDLVLEAARTAGYGGIEMRPKDFGRGDIDTSDVMSADDIIKLVRDSGLAVSSLAAARGWMFAEGDRLRSIMAQMHWACEHAVRLGTDLIISPVDPGVGDVAKAIDRTGEIGELVAQHGLRIAIQMNSWARQINTLPAVMEILEGADHPRVGYLIDTYHMHRSGAVGRGFSPIRPEKIFHVQVSDVPAGPRQRGVPLDRLPLGQGVIPFDQVFGLLVEKGYNGWIVYEVPNPAVWVRDPLEVAQSGLEEIRSRWPG